MIISYSPINGSGPLRVTFTKLDFMNVPALECPEESGVYWISENKLAAIEFDDVKASNDSITITIPETGDKFCLTVNGGSIHLESAFLKSLAS
jgi:hypothetical protein